MAFGNQRIQLQNGNILELGHAKEVNGKVNVYKFGRNLLHPNNILDTTTQIYDDFITFINWAMTENINQKQRYDPFDNSEVYPELNTNSSIEDIALAGKKFLNHIDELYKSRFKDYVVCYYLNDNARMYVYYVKEYSSLTSETFGSVEVSIVSNLFYTIYSSTSGTFSGFKSEYGSCHVRTSTKLRPHLAQSILSLKAIAFLSAITDEQAGLNYTMVALADNFQYSVGSSTEIKDEYGGWQFSPAYTFNVDLNGNEKMPLDNNYYFGNENKRAVQSKYYYASKLGCFPFTCVARADGKTVNYVKDLWDILYLKNKIDFGDIVDDTKIPDNPGGSSTTGGGNGNFDDTSDAIDIPALPPSFVSNNMVNFYVPTQMQLNAISRYMWSSFDLDTFKRLFTDPMNAFISLNYLPFRPDTTTTSKFVVGNVSTDIDIYKTSEQFTQVDCGEVNLKEFWGNYLDYAPYSKVEIFLPYIGIKQLDIDDVMESTIKVVYHLDITTGSCVCFIKISRGNLNSVLYSFEGNCAVNIPLSSIDFRNTMSSIASLIADGGMMVATGGMSSTIRAGAAIRTIADVGESVTGGGKPMVQKSGTLTANHGIMGIQKPYIIVTRPRQCVPGQQKLYTGYPSFITERLSSLSGYTIVENIHLDGVTATDAEMIEIENLLKEGVIL